MSVGILISRKRKNYLSNISLKTPTTFNCAEFKKYRNLYNSVIRSAKKLYFEKQLLINQKICEKLGKFYSQQSTNLTKKQMI